MRPSEGHPGVSWRPFLIPHFLHYPYWALHYLEEPSNMEMTLWQKVLHKFGTNVENILISVAHVVICPWHIIIFFLPLGLMLHSKLGTKKVWVFFSDLFMDGTFASFEILQHDHDWPKSHFFRYLQAHSFAIAHYLFPVLPAKNMLDSTLDRDPYTKGKVSGIYKTIEDIKLLCLDKTKSAWEKDLNTELTEETWDQSLRHLHTSSLCLRHCLVQFKVLHWLHFTREKLSKIYPNNDPVCVRCHLKPATTWHMFWECISLISFWDRIFEAFSTNCHAAV